MFFLISEYNLSGIACMVQTCSWPLRLCERAGSVNLVDGQQMSLLDEMNHSANPTPSHVKVPFLPRVQILGFTDKEEKKI